jgi:hypothetical protein
MFIGIPVGGGSRTARLRNTHSSVYHESMERWWLAVPFSLRDRFPTERQVETCPYLDSLSKERNGQGKPSPYTTCEAGLS